MRREAWFQDVLTGNRLELYGQKIVACADGLSPCGAECLLRVRSHRGPLRPPMSLLRVGQRLQCMALVDEWVLREVRRITATHGAALRAGGRRISVNLSGQSLSDPDFLQCFEQWVCAAPELQGLITFEITETAAIRDLGRVRGCMRRLQRIGCRFALDDFGVGVNSLSYLKALPVDAVKLDGMFVRDLACSARSRATVSAVTQLAGAFGIVCVAEYVESQAILKLVRELGVDYAQGYAIHRPEPLTAVLEALRLDAQHVPAAAHGVLGHD